MFQSALLLLVLLLLLCATVPECNIMQLHILRAKINTIYHISKKI